MQSAMDAAPGAAVEWGGHRVVAFEFPLQICPSGQISHMLPSVPKYPGGQKQSVSFDALWNDTAFSGQAI